MPKVSVIIPAYNAMQFLPQAIESVFGQTFTDFELLLVNDGSSDETFEWASKIKDSRFSLISKSNQGVSSARNTGIANSAGEYIAFLDADDYWRKNKLYEQVQYLDNNPSIGLVDTLIELVDENSNFIDQPQPLFRQGNVYHKILSGNIIYCGSSPLIRRACFNKSGFFDENLYIGEDWDMWIRIASNYPFGIVEEPLACYRQHARSASTSFDSMADNFNKIISKNFKNSPIPVRNRAFAYANLYIAWRSLIAEKYIKALSFCRKSIFCYPQIIFSGKCIRLLMIIATKSWISDEIYLNLKKLKSLTR